MEQRRKSNKPRRWKAYRCMVTVRGEFETVQILIFSPSPLSGSESYKLPSVMRVAKRIKEYSALVARWHSKVEQEAQVLPSVMIDKAEYPRGEHVKIVSNVSVIVDYLRLSVTGVRLLPGGGADAGACV